MDKEIQTIIESHNKAAESFHETRIALASLRMEERRLSITREKLEQETDNALRAMIEANNAALALMRKNQ